MNLWEGKREKESYLKKQIEKFQARGKENTYFFS